jgi:hypothetical protein
MPPGKRRLPPKARAYRARMRQRHDRRLEAAAAHLHASHERTLSPDTPPEAAGPPLPIAEAISDTDLNVDGQLVDGDTVVSRWTVYGIHAKPLAGFAATDRDVTITGMTVATFDDKQVVRQVSFWDQADLLGQLESFRR